MAEKKGKITFHRTGNNNFHIKMKTKKHDKHKQNLTIVSTNSISQVIMSKTAKKKLQTLHHSTASLGLTLFFRVNNADM